MTPILFVQSLLLKINSTRCDKTQRNGIRKKNTQDGFRISQPSVRYLQKAQLSVGNTNVGWNGERKREIFSTFNGGGLTSQFSKSVKKKVHKDFAKEKQALSLKVEAS